MKNSGVISFLMVAMVIFASSGLGNSSAFAQIQMEEHIETPDSLVIDRNGFDHNSGFSVNIPLLSIGDPNNGGLEVSIRRRATPFRRFDVALPNIAGHVHTWTLSSDSNIQFSDFGALAPEVEIPPEHLVGFGYIILNFMFENETVRLMNLGHEFMLDPAPSNLEQEHGIGSVIPVAGISKLFFPGRSFAYLKATPGQTILNAVPTTIYHEDGRKIQFEGLTSHYVSSIEYPNGVKHTYNYVPLKEPDSFFGCTEQRLQSITSNAGYMLHFTYETDPSTPLPPAPLVCSNPGSAHSPNTSGGVTKITAINTNVYDCSPTAFQCSDSQGADWPYVLLNGLDDWHPSLGITGWRKLDSIEDRQGNKTTFSYDNYSLNSDDGFSMSSPQDTEPDFSYTFGSFGPYQTPESGQRYEANIAGENWTYSIFQTDNLGESGDADVTGPEGYTASWISNYIRDFSEHVYDTVEYTQNGRIWTCDPSCSVKQKTTTYPGGRQLSHLYLSSLLYESRQIAEPGSTESDIVQTYDYRTADFQSTDPNDAIAKYDDWRNYNKPISYEDPLGNIYDFDHDPDHGGLLNSQKPAPGIGAYASVRPETRVTYKDIGNGIIRPDQTFVCATAATCAGTADETITTYTYYSVSGQVETQTVSAGDGSNSLTSRYTYTPMGDIETVDGPLPGTGDTVYSFYDDLRRLRATVAPDPDGAGPLQHPVIRYSYNADGNITILEGGYVSVPSNWNTMTVTSRAQTAYDPYGRKIREEVIKIGGPENGQIAQQTQYSYDGRGRVKCMAQRMNPDVYATPPSEACTLGTEGSFGPDRITKTEYTVHDEVAKVIRAYGTPLQQDYQTYTYYDDGMVESVTDANGNQTTYYYDGFNRLVKTEFPDKITPGVSSTADFEEYTYDAAGNRTSLRKRDGRIINYDYDNLNRLSKKDIPNSTTLDVYYGYDLRDLSIYSRFASHSGTGIAYDYDALGRMTSETDEISSRTLFSDYNELGNRTHFTFSDGETFQYGFDTASRITGLFDPTGRQLVDAVYRDDGLLASASRGTAGAITTFDYDDINRLSLFEHDFSLEPDDLEVGFEFNPVSQITRRSLSNVAFQFDDLSGMDRAYLVNGLNQYTEVGGLAYTYDDNGNLTSDGVNTYGYDVENRLTSITGGVTASLEYDPLGRLASLTVNGLQTQFTYDGNAMVEERDGSGALLRRYVHGIAMDTPLIWFEGSDVNAATERHLHANHQRSIIAISDSSGDLLQQNSYSPFGIGTNEAFGRFGYTGQMRLPGLGLYYYKARIYGPDIGRFFQVDPIGYEGGQNIYVYVGNDPLNWIDPTGLCCDPYEHMNPFEKALRQSQDDPVTQEELLALAMLAVDAALIAVDIANFPSGESIAMIGARRAAMEGAETSGTAAVRRAVCCFAAGTLVHTEVGLKPIEDVSVGDFILARDEQTGLTAYKPVSNLIRNHHREIWKLSVKTENGNFETFETTDDHPWWIEHRGWTNTAHIKLGDKLATRDGSQAVVTSLINTHTVHPTYNLTVSEYSTYFVGEIGIWVHNDNCFSQRVRDAMMDLGVDPAEVVIKEGIAKVPSPLIGSPTAVRRNLRTMLDGLKEAGATSVQMRARNISNPQLRKKLSDAADAGEEAFGFFVTRARDDGFVLTRQLR